MDHGSCGFLPCIYHFSFELWLLDLASFLGPVCFGLFGDFIPKGENVRPKQACGLSLQVVSRMLTSGFKDMRPKVENVNMKIKKGEV
jgi:hypothetical protein